jgi:hypothetical protein
MSAEQKVINDLHEFTYLCNGSDTCSARAILEPLLAERDTLYEALAGIMNHGNAEDFRRGRAVLDTFNKDN